MFRYLSRLAAFPAAVMLPLVAAPYGLADEYDAARFAPPRLYEQEPNNTPDQARRFAGHAVLIGEVSGRDQDAWMWTVEDEDADHLWSISLSGETDGLIRLDIIELSYHDPDAVAQAAEGGLVGALPSGSDAGGRLISGSQTHLTIQTRRGHPVGREEELLLPPGDYLIGMSAAGGGGEYEVQLRRGRRAALTPIEDITPEADGVIPVPAGEERVVLINAESGVFALDVPDDQEEGQLWRVSVIGGLGARLSGSLTDADGARLAATVTANPLRQHWRNVALEPGARLEIETPRRGDQVGIVAVALEPLGVAAPGEEREPNDTIAQANWTDLAEDGFAGALDGQRDTDFLAFSLSEAETQGSQTLMIGTESEAEILACLHDFTERQPICRRHTGEHFTFGPLQLGVGDYALSLRAPRNRSGTLDYTVALETGRAPAAAFARQPNDNADWAAPMEARRPVRAETNIRRWFWFEMPVSGAPQLWRFQANGEAVRQLQVREAEFGREIASDSTSRPTGSLMRLDRLMLLPGRYLIGVEADSDIMLRAIPLGQPEPGWEVEPNDDALTANVLTLGERMQGNFHNGDIDMFTFTTHGWSQVSVALDPPSDTAARVRLLHQGREIAESAFIEGRRIEMGGLLPAGDYHVELRGQSPSELEYALMVDIDAPWATPGGPVLADRAPVAQTLPSDGQVVIDRETLTGRVSSHWIALPVADSDREISVRVETGGIRTLAVLNADLEPHAEGGGQAGETLTTSVAAGEAWLIHATGFNGAPSLAVDDPALAAPDETFSLSLAGEAGLAAWLPERQRVELQLEISNQSDAPALPDLELAASHAGVRLEYDPPEANLEPGGQATITVHADLPAWLSPNDPARVWVRAGAASAAFRFDVDPGAQPANPYTGQADPDLTGLVNLAWDALGARFVETPENRDRAFHLINNTVGGDTGLRWHGLMGEPLPAIELAQGGGDIQALVFDQTSSLPGQQRWRRVLVEHSADGRVFEPLVTAELDIGDGQQVYRLDDAIEATHLRLTPLSDWGSRDRAGQRSAVVSGTGLVMALGRPANDARPNLLDPMLGGHVVWADGAQRVGRSLLHGALQRSHGSQGHHQREAQRLGVDREIVVGFNQQRIALLDALEWRTGAAQRQNGPASITVSVSTTSPLGPWSASQTLALNGGEGRLDFDEPVAARYVRFQFQAAGRQFTVPEHVAAYEADGLGSGRSILGHWGWYTHRGPWEVEPEALYGDIDTASTPAAPIRLGDGRRGRLQAVGDVRAYTVTVPEGENTLEIALSENVSERAAVRLYGPGGEAVIEWERDGADRRGVAAGLAPGEHRIELEEPVRSIAIVWDGSGSLMEHRPAIFRAFAEFADGLIPDQEVANIIPLGFPPLIDGWAEYGAQLSQALAFVDLESRRFMRDAATSDAETGLLAAARRLDRREGERAIILIADAELITPHRPELWPMLERVRPRIFALGMNPGNYGSDTAKLLHERDLIMNWAMATGGRFSYSASTASLLRNLEAAMHEIRQPTEFFVSASTGWTDPPEPGALSVVSGDEPAVAGSVVHMIFDASGSMLRRMEGGRRIEVARTVARDAIDARIPSHVPVALRAFGHTEPGSCETELLVAPSAGNHAEVLSAVERIQAINLARTPLAASLAAVRGDLEGFTDGRQLVVMLTDGEETCGGNVEAELERLMDSGVEVRLNIVGFHIDQASLRDEFERLAELGGGVYFDTRDGDGLQSALAEAMAAEFTVRDSEGAIIARGRVDGNPVALDAGRYRLVIEGHEEREIVIEPDTEIQVRMGSG
ncbi:MAG: VWA domain-containing protein [Oceanicaulis sp.]